MSSQWVGWNPTIGVKISPSKPKDVKADAASVMRIPPRKKTPKHSTAAQRGSLLPVKFAPTSSDSDDDLPDINVDLATLRKISSSRATFGSYETERPIKKAPKQNFQPAIDLSASSEEEAPPVRSVRGPLGARASPQKAASWNNIFTSPPVAVAPKAKSTKASTKSTTKTAPKSTTGSTRREPTRGILTTTITTTKPSTKTFSEKKHWRAELDKKKQEESNKLKALYPRFHWANVNRKGNFRPPSKRIFTSDPDELRAALEEIYTRKGERCCSLDLEWEFDRKGAHRTALVQVGTLSTVVIFSVSQREQDVLPQCLVNFLEDPEFIKVGVNIKGDADKLHRDFPNLISSIRGLLELQKLAFGLDQPHFDAIGMKRHHISLQKLVAHYMNLYLDKGERKSAWEDKELSEMQLDYAAGDVVAALQVFLRLVDLAMLSIEQVREYCFDV